MSQLKARCVDQVLMFENTPVITSGNINYDSIMFDFCSAWDGFTKTAIFYRYEDEVYYQLLDKANTCIIPKEVLREKGDVYIGVFGVNGDTTLTSQVLKYKIAKGAITENLKPSDPTPDIYSQIISRYNHYDERLEYFEERFNGSVGDAEKLGGQLPSYYATAAAIAALTTLVPIKVGDGQTVTDCDELAIGTMAYVYYTATNSPFSSMSSHVFTYGLTSNLKVQIAIGASKQLVKVRSCSSGAWSAWSSEFATTADLAKYLPLTGGTVNGSVKLSDSTSARTIALFSYDNTLYMRNQEDTDNFVDIQFPTSGNPRVYQKSNGSGTSYTLLHTGNMADHVLPKTGGHLTGNAHTPLIVDTTYSDSDFVRIGFYQNNVVRGYLGFREGKPTFTDTSYEHNTLLHAGNYSEFALPINGGGTVKRENDTVISVENTKAGGISSYIGYKVANGEAQYMGFSNGKPYISGMGEILHTGNSAKLHINDTAPSDTSSAWIDTSE